MTMIMMMKRCAFYYYLFDGGMELVIGYPSKVFFYNLDSGSTILYFRCFHCLLVQLKAATEIVHRTWANSYLNTRDLPDLKADPYLPLPPTNLLVKTTLIVVSTYTVDYPFMTLAFYFYVFILSIIFQTRQKICSTLNDVFMKDLHIFQAVNDDVSFQKIFFL